MVYIFKGKEEENRWLQKVQEEVAIYLICVHFIYIHIVLFAIVQKQLQYLIHYIQSM